MTLGQAQVIAALGRLGDRRSDYADAVYDPTENSAGPSPTFAPVDYTPSSSGRSDYADTAPSRLTPANVPDPPLGTPPSTGPSSTPSGGRGVDTTPSRPASAPSLFPSPVWSSTSPPTTPAASTPATAAPAATGSPSSTPAAGRPAQGTGITPQDGYNPWTGITTPLTPVQASVINAVGREQLNNRAAQEAIAAEAERLGAARGLNVECEVDYSSGPQSYLYQTVCSVNGSPFEYGGDLLIRPGGFDSAAVSRGLPLQTGGGSYAAGAVPGSNPGGTVTGGGGTPGPGATTPTDASTIDQLVAQAKQVPWYGWAALGVVVLMMTGTGRSN